MEKQVIFRDRQELQSADLNNIESYAAASLQHLTQDAISKSLHFTGGLVSAASATEVTVASLRFYNDGKVYVSEQEQTLNLFQYLPLVTKKCVAVVLWGQETDTLVEPRDFLIDLTTGATQPDISPGELARIVSFCSLSMVYSSSGIPAPSSPFRKAEAYKWVIRILRTTGYRKCPLCFMTVARSIVAHFSNPHCASRLSHLRRPQWMNFFTCGSGYFS